ncbi:MAG: UDP-N-acetylmuramate dehydrogenase [Pseudomonadota bacterium]
MTRDRRASAPTVVTPVDRLALERAARGVLRWDEPLSRHTTFRIGGPAEVWFEPVDSDDLRTVVALCQERGLPCWTIGGGSNLLVRDGGVRGVAIATRRLRGLRRLESELPAGSCVEAGAGLATGSLLATATTWNLGGLELLAGIPGTVGGAVFMNAGTYLGTMKDVTREVRSLRMRDGVEICRPAGQCGFGYRHTCLPTDEVITSVLLELTACPRDLVEAKVRDLHARRRERQPRVARGGGARGGGGGVAGSIFRNPAQGAAGKLLEQAGMKGKSVGAAVVSPHHANWIVNTGGATASDVLALIDILRDRIFTKLGIELELEIRVVGEDDDCRATISG